jgi:hypothetical protein
MKKNKTERGWWTGLTADDMKNISKKKPRKKISESWSDEYSDVDRTPKKSKKFKK